MNIVIEDIDITAQVMPCVRSQKGWTISLTLSFIT